VAAFGEHSSLCVLESFDLDASVPQYVNEEGEGHSKSAFVSSDVTGSNMLATLHERLVACCRGLEC